MHFQTAPDSSACGSHCIPPESTHTVICRHEGMIHVYVLHMHKCRICCYTVHIIISIILYRCSFLLYPMSDVYVCIGHTMQNVHMYACVGIYMYRIYRLYIHMYDGTCILHIPHRRDPWQPHSPGCLHRPWAGPAAELSCSLRTAEVLSEHSAGVRGWN